jgi:hypothetical protein
VGAENSSVSRHQPVFVDEPAQTIGSDDAPQCRSGGGAGTQAP